MKTAQEVRVGNVVMVSGEPMVVLKAEYTKSGRNASVVKLKMKNLLVILVIMKSLLIMKIYQQELS